MTFPKIISLTILLFLILLTGCLEKPIYKVKLSGFESFSSEPLAGDRVYIIPVEKIKESQLLEVFDNAVTSSIRYHREHKCHQMLEKYMPVVPWWRGYSTDETRKYLDSRKVIQKIDCDQPLESYSDKIKYYKAVQKVDHVMAKDIRNSFFNRLSNAFIDHLDNNATISLTMDINGKAEANLEKGDYFFLLQTVRWGTNSIWLSRQQEIIGDIRISLSNQDQSKEWERFSYHAISDRWVESGAVDKTNLK